MYLLLVQSQPQETNAVDGLVGVKVIDTFFLPLELSIERLPFIQLTLFLLSVPSGCGCVIQCTQASSVRFPSLDIIFHSLN